MSYEYGEFVWVRGQGLDLRACEFFEGRYVCPAKIEGYHVVFCLGVFMTLRHAPADTYDQLAQDTFVSGKELVEYEKLMRPGKEPSLS